MSPLVAQIHLKDVDPFLKSFGSISTPSQQKEVRSKKQVNVYTGEVLGTVKYCAPASKWRLCKMMC